eukprot:3971463-Amphidinium_carterae.2
MAESRHPVTQFTKLVNRADYYASNSFDDLYFLVNPWGSISITLTVTATCKNSDGLFSNCIDGDIWKFCWVQAVAVRV